MQEAILKFKGPKGTWKIMGTRSTGKYTCSDTYHLEGTGEVQEMDRDKLYLLLKQNKISIFDPEKP